MSAIKGLHHVSLKTVPAEFETLFAFYRDTLGLPVIRADGGCAMLDLGNTILELVAQDGIVHERSGSLDHIALQVAPADVDALLKSLQGQGYAVTMEPTDIVICGNYPARIAFFTGPCGESVELFAER